MSEYTIQSGDTLSKIASQNNTTVQGLASLNKISDVNKISAGQKIQLTPSAAVGLNVNSTTTQPNNSMKVVQPQPNVKNAVLQSDLISQGQQATQKALQDELAQAQRQGTPTDNIIRNILASGTTTPPATPTTPTTASNSNGLSLTQDSLNTQKQGILDMMSGTQGEVALTNAEFANTVDPARQELNTINAEMNTESLAGRRRIEAVMNIVGITKEQAQDKINEISRTNTSKLADIAVIQMAVQGKYDSAKEIADRSVQAKLEVQKNKRDAMLFMYTENKELFTKTEQRQFETSQRDRERKLNAEEKTLQRVSDLSIEALKNGASTSLVTKMQNAKTEAEAIAFGGQFIGLLDRQDKMLDRKLKNAQLGKIYSDIAESKTQAGGNVGGQFNQNLKAYANNYNQTGVLPSPTDLKKMGISIADVTMAAKQIPKQVGQIIDRNTGVTSQTISASQQDGIGALYALRANTAKMIELDKRRVTGVIGGFTQKILGGNIETRYEALRNENVDLLARARSGAALTVDEATRYENLLPGRFSNSLFLGASSQTKLKSFDDNITNVLESKLNASGLAMSGYSQAVVEGYGSQVIGTILDIGGQQFRVLPDGTLTDIIQ